jgi:malonyl-CoA/methylmalonyl-CoA synthetase
MLTLAQARAHGGSFLEGCRVAWRGERPLLLLPDGRQLTYGEAEDRAARYGAVFAAHGLVKGDRVAAQVDKSPEALFLYLACLRYGAVYVPVNPGFTPPETRFLLEDSRPSLVVCAGARAGMVRDWFGKTVAIETLGDGGGSLAERAHALPPHAGLRPAADDLAAILYTSGTTGKPKGALHTQRSLLLNAVALREAWRFSGEDVLLHSLPFFHAHGLFVSTHCALSSGSALQWHARFDTDAVIDGLTRCTVFMGVPTMYHRLLKSERLTAASCSGVRLFASGSAALPEDAFLAFERRTGQRIVERYGMSEAGIIATNPYSGARKPGSVGVPLPVTEVRVTGGNGQPQPAGVDGDVRIRGASIFHGYWGRPDLTADELATDGWFRTGDVGHFDDEGYLHLMARAKDVIISGGYNVYPAEIEDVLKRIEGVHDAAVIGVPHPDFGEGVTAVLCVAPDGPSEQAILTRARLELVGYKVPKRVFFVEGLPVNAIGKVLKQELRQRYADTYAGGR